MKSCSSTLQQSSSKGGRKGEGRKEGHTDPVLHAAQHSDWAHPLAPLPLPPHRCTHSRCFDSLLFWTSVAISNRSTTCDIIIILQIQQSASLQALKVVRLCLQLVQLAASVAPGALSTVLAQGDQGCAWYDCKLGHGLSIKLSEKASKFQMRRYVFNNVRRQKCAKMCRQPCMTEVKMKNRSKTSKSAPLCVTRRSILSISIDGVRVQRVKNSGDTLSSLFLVDPIVGRAYSSVSSDSSSASSSSAALPERASSWSPASSQTASSSG